MGNDGGSIPRRCEIVKTKKKEIKYDPAVSLISKWFLCSLSKKPLESPVVVCPLGKLYNKESILEYFINKDKYGDADKICGHIKSLSKVRTLKLMDNPSYKVNNAESANIAPFVCPLTLKEMNGKHKFVYLQTCCCVFSEAGLKEMQNHSALNCPSCNSPYALDDVTELCPPQEVQDQLALELQAKRDTAALKHKRKLDAPSETAEASLASSLKKPKQASILAPPTISPTAPISNLLRAKEKSSAIKSIYATNNGPETHAKNFLCRGTFNRYA